ncbi:MAG: HetP family heterocyst commitment protein [Trichormus sp. ATA11-4-KO1]|jgi:hypothetical protein|nr:HetP family heterocyst commitment protein [Trichormus sp. ATA11-4-KO1]
MNQDIPGISSNFNKAMNPQQFDQIVEAILAGKYSWACVLMLRIVGYNPLHYIPYRTYNRLLKENTQVSRTHQQHNESMKTAQPSASKRSDMKSSPGCLSKIKDLAYLEVVGNQTREIRGGSLNNSSAKQMHESQPISLALNPEKAEDESLKICEFN